MSGRILGDYEVIKQIGHGALGTVFLAEHRFMKKQYMLKVLPEELASDRGFIQRFEDYVGALTVLEHPNIVKIHNVSFSQGLYFLVTDCVVDEVGETTNLAQYLAAQQGALLEQQVLMILQQVAQALDYSHTIRRGEKTLIHSGLKLNNILVGNTKPDIDVKLCDFGLSAVIGDAAIMTRTFRVVAETLGVGDRIGLVKSDQEGYPNPPVETEKLSLLQRSFLQNFLFLAPEQKHRSNELLDEKVDVYAFGVLAYYLLTKQFPEGAFPLPSEVSSFQMHWDQLIKSCLHPDPEKRPLKLEEVVASVFSPAKVVVETPLPPPMPEGQQLSGMELLNQLQEKVVSEKPAPQMVLATPQQQGNPEPAPEVPQQLVKAPVAETSMPPKAVAKNPSAPMVNVGAAPSTMVDTVRPMEASQQSPKPVLGARELQRPSIDPDPAKAFQVDSTVKQYQPEPSEVKNVEPIPTDMIVIKGWEFFRGSNDGNRDELPRHKVNINSFAIDIHSVTNEQFVRFLDVMGGEKDHNHQDLIKLKESRIKRSGGKLSIESGYAKHPVVGVTWYGSVTYARWIGKRLPTEAEWEIASRGGNEDFLYPMGHDIEKSQANFFSADTTLVKSYAANDYGLFDMPGNVYEWCQDWYGYNYYEQSAQEPDNPKGPLQGVYRVLRGGCWKSLKEDLRSSRRHRNNPGTANSTYGFRCCCDVE